MDHFDKFEPSSEHSSKLMFSFIISLNFCMYGCAEFDGDDNYCLCSSVRLFSDFNGLRGFGEEERVHHHQHHEHHHNRPGHQERHDKRNYKLICDPALRHGPQKIYRFDGESATVRKTWVIYVDRRVCNNR